MHTRRTVVAVVALCALFMSFLLLPEVAASEGAREPAKPLAEMAIAPTRVDWTSNAGSESLVLTVAGPGDFYLREEFPVGQNPRLSLFQPDGKQLPDGIYTFELRRVVGKLLEKPILDSGYLSIRGGSFVATESGEPRVTSSESPIKPITANLVIAENVCIGDSCESGDDDFSALKLKSKIPWIRFEDVAGIGPDRDWDIWINALSGSGEFFAVRDSGAETLPFTVQGGAPESALYVRTNGNLGLGTSTPAQDIHAMSGNTPTLRLEQDGSGGFSARAWDIGANHTELFVKDVTNNTIPFRIKSGAASDSLVVASTGRVEMGTLLVSAGETRLASGPSGGNIPTVFKWFMDQRNYIRGETIIGDTGGKVGIGTASPAPSSKLHVHGGDIVVTGGSFVDDGVILNVPDYVFEPGYSLMPLAELREFVAREKHLPNVPTAADIKKEGLNLSQFQMRLLEKIEELALYTLQQEEDVRSLRDENLELKARLEALEKAQASSQPR